jgi:hypothetical protein
MLALRVRPRDRRFQLRRGIRFRIIELFLRPRAHTRNGHKHNGEQGAQGLFTQDFRDVYGT